MKNNKNSFSLVIGILVGVYVFLYLVIPIDKKIISNWIEFAFTLISIFFTAFVGIKFIDKNGLKSKFYALPVLSVAVTYTAAQFICGAVIFAVNGFMLVKPWVALSLSAVLLAVACIGAITDAAYADTVEKKEQKYDKVLKSVKNFRLDITSVLANITDDEVKKAAEKFAEELRFSDPVSSEASEAIEHKMQSSLDELKTCLNDKQKAMSIINDLNTMLTERNSIVKANK